MSRKKRLGIAIEELREAGEDGGDLMGYFCRGHIDRHEFAKTANAHTGASYDYDVRFVHATAVRHEWWRNVQMEGQPKGVFEFKPSLPGKGAWPVTVDDSVYRHGRGITRREIREHDRGYGRGMAEGVNWALQFLDARDAKLRDAMLAAYRANREKLEAPPLTRWHASITYRGNMGPVEVEHDLAEISGLDPLIERGPHWDTIDRVVISRVNHSTISDLTIEEAAKL